MKVKEYTILTNAIETGVNIGYARAHKHTDTPSETVIKNQIYQAVLNEICDNFTFEDNEQCESTPA